MTALAMLARRLVGFLLLVVGLAAAAQAKTCTSYDVVQIQLKWLQQAQFAGYLAAVAQGFYTEECLEVYIRPGGSNIDMAEEVLANRAQIGIDWLASLLVSREAGLDVIIISQVFARTALLEISFTSQDVTKPTDMKGKNVCVWTGGNELSLKGLFDKYDMRWDNDTTRVQSSNSDANIISQSFTMTDFLAGTCDTAAAMTYNEYALVLEATDPTTGALYTADSMNKIDYNNYNLSTFEDHLFVSTAWLAEDGNEDIVVRFLRASNKGWLFARDYPAIVNTDLFNSAVHQDWQNNEVSKLIFPTWSDGFGVAPAATLQEAADRIWKYGAVENWPNATEFYRSDLALRAYQGMMGLLADEPPTTGWDADLSNGIYGSADVRGETYVARDLRFCYNNGALALCEGVRGPASTDFLSATSGAGVAVLTIATIALAFIVFLGFGLIWYREDRIVVASSLPFCIAICLGAAIFISSVFLSVGEAATGRCHARIWMLGVGFATMLGAFLIKVRRIDKILNNKAMQVQRLPNDLLFKQLGVVVAIEVVLLALFSGLAGWESQTYDDTVNGKLTHTLCVITNRSAADATIALLFSYKALILLACARLAYKTKDVLSQFNESQYLAAATYNFTIIAAVVVPIVFFLGLKPDAQLIVSDVGAIIGATLSCLILFGPKLVWAHQCISPSDNSATMATGTGTLSPRYADVLKARGVLSQHESSGSIIPKPNAPAMAMAHRESSAMLWQRGLKALTVDVLLSHLRFFRIQEEQVRTELRAKGLTDTEITLKLDGDGPDSSGSSTPRVPLSRAPTASVIGGTTAGSTATTSRQGLDFQLRPLHVVSDTPSVVMMTTIESRGTDSPRLPSYAVAMASNDVIVRVVDETPASASTFTPLSQPSASSSARPNRRLRVHMPGSTHAHSMLPLAHTHRPPLQASSPNETHSLM